MEDEKLIRNARKPEGELGSQLLDRMNKSHEEMALWGVSHFKVREDDSILDIGCGGGVNVERFAKLTNKGKSFGVDYSEVSVEKSIFLNKDFIDKGIVEIKKASVSSLPYEDNTFNIVTAFETIYFWPDFINDLKEVLRVLKPGGFLFICNEVLYENNNLEKREKLSDILDMNIYSDDDLKDSLLKAGFKDFKLFKNKENGWISIIAFKSK